MTPEQKSFVTQLCTVSPDLSKWARDKMLTQGYSVGDVKKELRDAMTAACRD